MNYRILGQQKMQLKSAGWLPTFFPRLNSMAAALNSVTRRAFEIDRHVRAFNASVLIACTASPFIFRLAARVSDSSKNTPNRLPF